MSARSEPIPVSETQEFLHIYDSRSARKYSIPIRDNVVRGSDLAKIQTLAKGVSSPESLKIFDPGLQNTAVMYSSVAKAYSHGSLTYRGHELSSLVGVRDHEDVAHLLILGRLPSDSEKQSFRQDIFDATLRCPSSVRSVVRSFPRDAPHINMMIAALSAALAGQVVAMPVLHGYNIYKGNLPETDAAIKRVIGTYCACLGEIFSYKANREMPQPEQGQSYEHNLYRLTGVIDDRTGRPNIALAKVLKRFWVMAADHELAHSASTMLMAASALGDPISCLISGMTAGYGILHVGAFEASYRTLTRIGNLENVSAALQDVKNQKDRIFGIGHRIYKTEDPRVSLVKETLQQLAELGYRDPLLDVAEEVERQVKADDYFTSRRLCVNPDLYFMFIWTSIGVPIEGVGPLFFGGRLSGLMAHYRELMSQKIKLWRPVQIHVRPTNDQSPGLHAKL